MAEPIKPKPAKRGAKLKGESARKRYQVNIDDDTNALLLELGGGNKSEGLHLMAAWYRENHPKK